MSDQKQTTFWLLGAMVSKQEPGRSVHNMVTGYRVCSTEDEARGSFLRSVMEMLPGFSLDQMTCAAVPPEHFPVAIQEPKS